MREKRRRKVEQGKRNWKRKTRMEHRRRMVTDEWGVSLPSPVFLNVHGALFLLCTLSTLEKYGKLMNACRTM